MYREILVGLVVLFICYLSSCSSGKEEECKYDTDCPGLEVCRNNKCVNIVSDGGLDSGISGEDVYDGGVSEGDTGDSGLIHRDVGRDSYGCSNPCECNSGEVCSSGECKYWGDLPGPYVFCCLDKTCPSNAYCVYPDGGRDICPENLGDTGVDTGDAISFDVSDVSDDSGDSGIDGGMITDPPGTIILQDGVETKNYFIKGKGSPLYFKVNHPSVCNTRAGQYRINLIESGAQAASNPDMVVKKSFNGTETWPTMDDYWRLLNQYGYNSGPKITDGKFFTNFGADYSGETVAVQRAYPDIPDFNQADTYYILVYDNSDYDTYIRIKPVCY